MSSDGLRLAVHVFSEDSNATGLNGNETDNSSSASGAVYVFDRSGSTWTQVSYIKAPNSDAGDSFGKVALSSGCSPILAVGVSAEDSSATGINGNQLDNSALESGAVYIIE